MSANMGIFIKMIFFSSLCTGNMKDKAGFVSYTCTFPRLGGLQMAWQWGKGLTSVPEIEQYTSDGLLPLDQWRGKSKGFDQQNLPGY